MSASAPVFTALIASVSGTPHSPHSLDGTMAIVFRWRETSFRASVVFPAPFRPATMMIRGCLGSPPISASLGLRGNLFRFLWRFDWSGRDSRDLLGRFFRFLLWRLFLVGRLCAKREKSARRIA